MISPLFVWSLTLTRPDGRTETVEASIGAPEWSAVLPDCWSCSILVKGRFQQPLPVFGATAIQALGLAVDLVRQELGALAATGALTDTVSGQAILAEMLDEASLRPRSAREGPPVVKP
ncbi:MAG: hypothetical protein ACT6RD_00400 [Brevundimonas sp.]|uniref:hypothetical protein n=1 Tax=Brevundimonas sp. TaxID=1871086 RepID=UPI00403499F9